MRTPPPLPAALASAPFTVQDALARGLSLGRLRASDLTIPSREIRIPANIAATQASMVRAILSLLAGAVASFATAALLWRIPLPREVEQGTAVHLSRQTASAASERDGVITHRVRLPAQDITEIDGIPVTTMPRTWLDLSRVLSLDSLVAAGDFLVCAHPGGFPYPREPLVDMRELQAVVERNPRAPGIRKAREALALLRVGADSPPESQLRLALWRANLPEPTLNHVIPNQAGAPIAWPDLAYPEAKLSLQYDGCHHLTPQQQDSDNSRNLAVADAGWDQLVVSQATVRRLTWQGVAALVKRRLRARRALKL